MFYTIFFLFLRFFFSNSVCAQNRLLKLLNQSVICTIFSCSRDLWAIALCITTTTKIFFEKKTKGKNLYTHSHTEQKKSKPFLISFHRNVKFPNGFNLFPTFSEIISKGVWAAMVLINLFANLSYQIKTEMDSGKTNMTQMLDFLCIYFHLSFVEIHSWF